MNSKIIIVFIIISNLFLVFLWSKDRLDRNLWVHILDVDQGDAILVRFPDRRIMLIDGGPGDYVLSRLGDVLPPWVRRIDILVLTHPHADHLNGLLDVLERYRVKSFVFNFSCYEAQEYENLLEKISEERIPVVEIGSMNTENSIYSIDQGGVTIHFLVSDGASGGDYILYLNNGSEPMRGVITIIR